MEKPEDRKRPVLTGGASGPFADRFRRRGGPRFEAPIGSWRSPRGALQPGASPICQHTLPRRVCWQPLHAPRCT